MDQSREGRELWRIMQMSSHDLLCEWFEHEQVRMHFARIAGENLVSPDEKATGMGVFVFVGFLETFGFGVAGRRLGRADRRPDRLHQAPRRRGAGGRRRRPGDGEERPRRRRRDRRRARIRGQGRGDRRHPPARPRQDGRGAGPRRRQDRRATQITDAGCITVHAALNEPLRFRPASTSRR